MATAELHDGKIAVWTEFREKELIKQVPGAKWDNDNRIWRLPLSWAACVQLRGVFNGSLKVGPELAAWSREELTGRVQPCLALRGAMDAEDLGLLTELYPFQRAGVKFMATAGSALNADEMGTGKTIQTIATLEITNGYPALIVAPNSMTRTWAQEFARWAPGRRVGVVSGPINKRRKVIAELAKGELDVIVINWEALRLHTRLAPYGYIRLSDKEKEEKELNALTLKTVVADEAHRAKNPQSKQTRALWWVGRKAERRYALTGTPVANAPEDLWAIMHFVAPHEWPTKTNFIDRYALQAWNNFGFMDTVGIRFEMKEELFKILDPRFIRRPKAVALPFLPPKTYTQRFVDLVPKQRRAYDQLRKHMIVELDGGYLLATNPLQKLVRLMQFASCLGQITEDNNLKLTEPSCKINALMEIVEELGEQQAVIFAESRQLIEIAATHLSDDYRIGLVTGAVSPDERQRNVDAFQAGQTQFLLATLGAGGEGLTLTAASVAIFLQRSFSEVKNKQAEDRVHRPGQDADKVEIIDLIATDTVEERVWEVRAEKGGRLEEIVRDEETVRRWLTK